MESKNWKISPNQLLFWGMLTVIGLIIFYSFSGAQIDADYARNIQIFRQKKDERFKHDANESPLDKAQREQFVSLRYYPVHPAYRITADLVWLKQQEQFSLPTSQEGQQQQYTKWAKAKFKLEGQEHEVLLLKSAEAREDKLYLFFKDATSGQETYAGGRYIEIEAKKSLTCVIDFNMAYNPYCAYNPYYVCPVPPAENTLPIAIQAGEMNFAGKIAAKRPD
jgi:hypothetical protein